jgi:hypothetical protein
LKSARIKQNNLLNNLFSNFENRTKEIQN